MVRLGANVDIFDRKLESVLRKNICDYDVIVNCVLWDTSRKDHIVSRVDLKRMRNDSMIVDISCDKHGGIETSIPTSLENPTYYCENVLHYVVDHTPTILYKAATNSISKVIIRHIDNLIAGNENTIIKKATIINKGEIIDNKILEYQKDNK